MIGTAPETARELWRYALVGVLGVLSDSLIFNIGLFLEMQLFGVSIEVTSKLLALTVTSSVAFWVHQRWTFQKRISTHSQFVTALKFALILLVGGAVSLGVIWTYDISIIAPDVWGANAANLLAVGLAALARFVLTRSFVFNSSLENRSAYPTRDTSS